MDIDPAAATLASGCHRWFVGGSGPGGGVAVEAAARLGGRLVRGAQEAASARTRRLSSIFRIIQQMWPALWSYDPSATDRSRHGLFAN